MSDTIIKTNSEDDAKATVEEYNNNYKSIISYTRIGFGILIFSLAAIIASKHLSHTAVLKFLQVLNN
jgi:hypothetical protein